MWVTKTIRMPASVSARMTWRAISEPSRSLVEANDSLHSSRPPAVIWPAMALILASSSSSFPFSIVASSSRLKCVKMPGADAGGERLRRHEHPGLHHQLGQAEAAQERRLSALVRAGDHDQLPAVRVQVVPDGPGVLEAQGQAGVIQAAGGQTGLLGAGRRRADRVREADRLALGGQPLPQVQAAEVEAQLGAEHLEEVRMWSADWASAFAVSLSPRLSRSDSVLHARSRPGPAMVKV